MIAAATLTGDSGTPTAAWCLHCTLRNPALAADLLVNVVLFMPLGAGLRLAGVRPALIVLSAFALSFFVEALQAYVVSGRVANVVDIATNTIGGTTGAAMAPHWRRVVFPDPRTSRALALASLVVFTAVVAGSAWGLSLATADQPLVVRGLTGRPTADRPERVLHAAVDGRTLRARDTVRTAAVRPEPMVVDVALQASRRHWDHEPALRLVANDRDFLELGIDEQELELDVRRRGADVRLLSPSIRLPRPGVGASPGDSLQMDTILLRAIVAPWRMTLTARAATEQRVLDLRLHPIAGWSLLVSNPRSPWLGELLTALWAAILVLPVAYWSASAASGGRRGALAAVAAALGVVAAAGIVVGVSVPPYSALAAIGLVIIATFAATRLAR